MPQQFDLRQAISLDTLTQLANSAANIQANLLMASADSEAIMPLRMLQSFPASRVVQIGAISVVNPQTSRTRTIPPIGGVLPTFASGTITLSSTGAGSATPSVGSALSLGMSASQYLKVFVYLNSSGNLVLNKGVAGASLSAATIPTILVGSYLIGYFVVRTDGSNNVQNVVNTDIYQFINTNQPPSRYVATFDATTSWGSVSGGYYTITYTAATHGRGVNPEVQIFQTTGTDNDVTFPERIRVASNGDVSFIVPNVPDCRFAGEIVIL